MTVRHIMGPPAGDAAYTLPEAIEKGWVVPAVCGELFDPGDPILNHPKIDLCTICRIGHEAMEGRPEGRLRGQHRTPIEVRQEYPHYVYRCYDVRDRLLYVGCTYNPPARMRQHRAERRPWVDLLARTRLTVWPDRRKALEMERLAIETEDPIYNKAFKRVAS